MYVTLFNSWVSNEMYAQESIALLKSAGIDFKKHLDYGIEVEEFGEYMISSGLVMSPVCLLRSRLTDNLAGREVDSLP